MKIFTISGIYFPLRSGGKKVEFKSNKLFSRLLTVNSFLISHWWRPPVSGVDNTGAVSGQTKLGTLADMLRPWDGQYRPREIYSVLVRSKLNQEWHFQYPARHSSYSVGVRWTLVTYMRAKTTGRDRFSLNIMKISEKLFPPAEWKVKLRKHKSLKGSHRHGHNVAAGRDRHRTQSRN